MSSYETCDDIYRHSRNMFDVSVSLIMLFWLFFTASYLPKVENQEEGSQWKKFPRLLDSCLNKYEDLMLKDDDKVLEAAKTVGRWPSVSFILSFILLQMLPILVLVIGVSKYYPVCECAAGCSFTVIIIGFIPIGTIHGIVLFFMGVCCLFNLGYLIVGFKKLRLVGTAASYLTVIERENEMSFPGVSA